MLEFMKLVEAARAAGIAEPFKVSVSPRLAASIARDVASFPIIPRALTAFDVLRAIERGGMKIMGVEIEVAACGI